MAPVPGSALRMPRIRKSPWCRSAWYSSMTIPTWRPWVSSSRSRLVSAAASSCRRVMAGRPPSSRTRLPSAEPQRDGRFGLHLAGPADHRLRHAADERERAGLLGDRREKRLGRVVEMGGGEQDPERRRAVPERRAGHLSGPASALDGIRGEHKGRADLHESRLRGRSAGRSDPGQPPEASPGRGGLPPISVRKS